MSQTREQASDSARLAVIEATVLELKGRLLGNGQPGEIEILSRRISKLEKFFWSAVGGGTALCAVWAIVSVVLPMVKQ